MVCWVISGRNYREKFHEMKLDMKWTNINVSQAVIEYFMRIVSGANVCLSRLTILATRGRPEGNWDTSNARGRYLLWGDSYTILVKYHQPFNFMFLVLYFMAKDKRFEFSCLFIYHRRSLLVNCVLWCNSHVNGSHSSFLLHIRVNCFIPSMTQLSFTWFLLIFIIKFICVFNQFFRYVLTLYWHYINIIEGRIHAATCI